MNPGAITTGKVTWSSSEHHTGSHSLSFHTEFDGGSVWDATVAVTICATDVLALQVSGYAMAVPDSGYSTIPDGQCEKAYSDAQAPVLQFCMTINEWVPFAGTFTNVNGSMTFLGLGLGFNVMEAPWNGTIYLDDVMIAAP